ncbi:LpxI family protein [Mangrovicella endophytica]|uniref:LpxI family protein n=1 Tax=Mangrovicella endophytica TaxID=2066697 RepID=UPI000C9E00A4|nr:UDP-2,3-diacylglucosamine diphosphatase LpxI [Mangrovicella endophytica]
MQPRIPGEPLGILAGGGRLPHLVAAAAASHGWTPYIIALGDGRSEDWQGFHHRDYAWGRVGNAIAEMKARGIVRMVLCGTISVRPDFRSIFPSLATLRILPDVLRIVRGGDDSVLRAVTRFLERRGFEALAVHDIAPELLMPDGLLTGRGPTAADEAALERAMDAVRFLGRQDIGQAVVASADRVIALEAIEGTRAMLQRVADLRQGGKIGRTERCVLVKSVKPQQDLRFDLPSIGASTMEEAGRAGLTGIGLSAGHAILIDADAVLAAAGKHGLFLTGLSAERLLEGA